MLLGVQILKQIWGDHPLKNESVMRNCYVKMFFPLQNNSETIYIKYDKFTDRLFGMNGWMTCDFTSF